MTALALEPRYRTGLAGSAAPVRLGPRLAPAPVGAGLEKHAKTAAISERHAGRLAAREVLRSVSHLPRVMRCGHALASEVAVRSSGLGCAVAGLETCGSVWACPVCSAKIAHGRSQDVEAGIGTWADRGGSFVLLTLTMRHRQGQALRDLWDGVSGAWRRWVSDGTVKRTRAALGVNGYHRTTEVTVGANGWHVHLHVLLFIEDRPGDLMSAHAGGVLVARWLKSVAAEGFSAADVGQDWKVLRGSRQALSQVAAYLTKAGYVESAKGRTAGQVAMEVARGDLKSARLEGSRTPFDLLTDIVGGVMATGELVESDLALWHEWEAASHGRRQQVWSRGMRGRLGLDDEASDADLAAAESEGVDLVAIPAREWARLISQPGAHADLIAACDAVDGQDARRSAAAAWLSQRGYSFRLLFPIE